METRRSNGLLETEFKAETRGLRMGAKHITCFCNYLRFVLEGNPRAVDYKKYIERSVRSFPASGSCSRAHGGYSSALIALRKEE